LKTNLGPDHLILAYLDDVYILSSSPDSLQQIQAFFETRQPSIQLNMAKSSIRLLEDIRNQEIHVLGSDP